MPHPPALDRRTPGQQSFRLVLTVRLSRGAPGPPLVSRANLPEDSSWLVSLVGSVQANKAEVL